MSALDQFTRRHVLATDLEQQLSQLDELLGLLDAKALRGAQESLENQIAELNERLEVTRQALVQAQAQRKRLARARLLLDESAMENNNSNSNGDPALHFEAPIETPVEAKDEEPVMTPEKKKPDVTAPFAAERRDSAPRRTNGERRQVEDRRSKN